jgi:hypothetical protein
MREQEKG